MTDIFGNLSCGGLCEGILSGHYIIDRGLDLGALAFKLGFTIGVSVVPIAAALV